MTISDAHIVRTMQNTLNSEVEQSSLKLNNEVCS